MSAYVLFSGGNDWSVANENEFVTSDGWFDILKTTDDDDGKNPVGEGGEFSLKRKMDLELVRSSINWTNLMYILYF